ncbi:MAG: RNA polymerase sigma factor region1.1 domain-containing protein [Ilumatobacteraceae bacterium]
MTDGVFDRTIESPHDAIDQGEWSALLIRGRIVGSVHADEVTHVLRAVELSAELLEDVEARLSAIGITIQAATEVADTTGELPVIVDPAPDADAGQRPAARRRPAPAAAA